MRRSLRWLAVALLATLPAVPAGALVLEVRGSLTLDVAGQIVQPGATQGAGLIKTFNITVNGPGASLGDHLTRITIPANQFATVNFLVDVTDPVAAPIDGLLANLANKAGVFEGGSGSGTLAGVMGLSGSSKVCLFADCNAAFVPANLSVPLGVAGAGGATFVSSFVNITVIGAPWTTGTVNVGDPVHGDGTSQMGFAHGPGSGTTSTASPSGVISLVTPLFISTSIPGSTSIVPGFAYLTLRITPEPGTLLLLGSGVAGLALLGRRRLRS